MFDDELHPEWYHSQCFFALQKEIHTSQIKNFENLKYEHQLEIILKINSNKNEISRFCRKRKHDEQISCYCYTVEYSSFYSDCIKCLNEIKKDTLRIKMLKDYHKTSSELNKDNLFVHLKCFHENRFEFKNIWGGELLQGFESLQHDDQGMFKDHLP